MNDTILLKKGNPAETVPVQLTRGVVLLLALTCSFIAAGSYLAQPILPIIQTDLGLGNWSGLAVTLTQIGFCFGLILIAPLGDLLENRKLVLCLISGSVLALASVGFAPNTPCFLMACFCIGLAATTVQILIPMAAYLVVPEARGRVMGSITSGLLLGVMLARPLSSMLSYSFGWRTMYLTVSGAIAIVTLLLFYFLPSRQPQTNQSYPAILGSLWSILKETPALRMLACCQASLFAAFSLFWTAVPFELVAHYGLNQWDVGLFALVGAGGALSSFGAGRIKNNSRQRLVRTLAITCTIALFMAIGSYPSLGVLIIAAIGIDAAVQFNHVLTQRAVVAISPTKVSRLNGLYAATLFVGGSIGSIMAIPLLSNGGWGSVAMGGLSLSIMAFFIGQKIKPA